MTGYVWRTGDGAFLLICGDDGVVVDHCPRRATAERVIDFFSTHGPSLVGVAVSDIKTQTGGSHSHGTLDRGVAGDDWSFRGKAQIALSGKDGACTAVHVKRRASTHRRA